MRRENIACNLSKELHIDVGDHHHLECVHVLMIVRIQPTRQQELVPNIEEHIEKVLGCLIISFSFVVRFSSLRLENVEHAEEREPSIRIHVMQIP